MGFYKKLSRYYDAIFAVDAGEMAFVSGLLKGRKRILDIGCGTGNKTVLLSEDAVVTGLDNDAEMIARAKTDNARSGIAYEILDMTRLEDRFAPASFDAAVCLGNTLVHLTAPGAAETLCAAVNRLLVPGGVFVCQILNYDRILDNNIMELPVIDTPPARFSRFYAREGDLLLFRAELLVKETGEIFRNETPLRPLRPSQLGQALRAAGFSAQQHYGSYAGEPFTPESFVIITAAEV